MTEYMLDLSRNICWTCQGMYTGLVKEYMLDLSRNIYWNCQGIHTGLVKEYMLDLSRGGLLARGIAFVIQVYQELDNS